MVLDINTEATARTKPITMEFPELVEKNKLKFLSAGELNYLIKNNGIDTNGISDGYHTFGELYNHRIELWIAICRILSRDEDGFDIWKSKKNSDGSEWEGWFLLGIGEMAGSQITYHLPISKWDECEFAESLELPPIFDGHTSDDVIERLKTL
jgi:hypothetical protein